MPYLTLTLLFLTGINLLASEKLIQPFSIVFDQNDTIYGVEYEAGNRVFKIEDGKVEFIAGSKTPGGKKLGDVAEGDGGPAKKGRFNGMHDLTLHQDGRLFIADTFNQRIRVMDLKTGQLSTLSEGKLTFKSPYTVDLNPDHTHLLVADLERRQVVEIDLKNLTLKPVAGNGKKGLPVNGKIALEEPLLAPRAAIYGLDGSIYLASREGHALRQIDPAGKIHTVVNTSGKKGYSGDSGPAEKARLNGPKHLALDPSGNIVISDDNNHAIRLYHLKTKTISLLAGTPTRAGSQPDQLNRPHGARYHSSGQLWVADSFNHRLATFPNRK